MDWFARAFIKASLAWLGLGVTLGILMALWPSLTIYSPAHMHMNLLGFVTMMIYGVAYHVLPRFTGHPLWSRRLPTSHWFASNIGLALMVCGLALRVHTGRSLAVGAIALAAGGIASAFGAYAFILNLWKTIDGTGLATTGATTPSHAAGTRHPAANRHAIRSRRAATDSSA